MDCPFHQDDGGHAVHGGVSFPIEQDLCGACVSGICRCGLACFMPEPDPQPPKVPLSKHLHTLLLATPEGRGRLIGAVLGLAGALFIAAHVLRYLQIL